MSDLTFEVTRGQLFGVLGPPGCGKTTAIRLITGAILPTQGEVTVLGRRPAEFSDQIRQKIGYMPKKSTLYPKLTVWENLCFAASLYGMGPFRRKRFRSILNLVNAGEQRHTLVSRLSAQVLWRVSLAVAIVHNPELILLDEPTEGMATGDRSFFYDCLVQLREQNRTILVTTQQDSEFPFFDSTLAILQGQMARELPEGLHSALLGVSPGV